MHNIHIAGTGIWHPEQKVSNEEIVNSYNSYVDNYNSVNEDSIKRWLSCCDGAFVSRIY